MSNRLFHLETHALGYSAPDRQKGPATLQAWEIYVNSSWGRPVCCSCHSFCLWKEAPPGTTDYGRKESDKKEPRIALLYLARGLADRPVMML